MNNDQQRPTPAMAQAPDATPDREDEANRDTSASTAIAPQQPSEEDQRSHQVRWDGNYNRLLAYREKHGNCLVPNRYPEDPQLGTWVSAQRRQYKIVMSGQSGSTAMNRDRVKKLMDIGFEWSTSNPKTVSWETRYNDLKDFVKRFGHAQVPMRWEENERLANWVSKQRQDLKLLESGQSSRLSQERIRLLDELGFVWEVDRATSRKRKGDVMSDSSSSTRRASDQKSVASQPQASERASCSSALPELEETELTSNENASIEPTALAAQTSTVLSEGTASNLSSLGTSSHDEQQVDQKLQSVDSDKTKLASGSGVKQQSESTESESKGSTPDELLARTQALAELAPALDTKPSATKRPTPKGEGGS